ncbi:hypothetical protein P378_03900 [Desulforamulus profundi]|uniref:Uncharacterized protein n=1 Tax=Desulforamulus profundi TaxID=1383067 RepID=A0A2C6LL76_9FIRM|nr:hypothetical protein P378_03900 [Desulforamulus profundi]
MWGFLTFCLLKVFYFFQWEVVRMDDPYPRLLKKYSSFILTLVTAVTK